MEVVGLVDRVGQEEQRVQRVQRVEDLGMVVEIVLKV